MRRKISVRAVTSPNFKLEGATGDPPGAAALIIMRDRIHRQISQRTRCRRRLARSAHAADADEAGLELIGRRHRDRRAQIRRLRMETMVEGYLDSPAARGRRRRSRSTCKSFLDEIVAASRATASRFADRAARLPPADAAQRDEALHGNLVGNACRHGSHVWLTALPGRRRRRHHESTMTVPASRRSSGEAFVPSVLPARPVAQHHHRRGRARLTIARDIARGHGGDLTLETSPQGGLRTRLHLPN